MAMKFKCPGCGEYIIIRYTTIGDEVRCLYCKNFAIVPENTLEVLDEDYTHYREEYAQKQQDDHVGRSAGQSRWVQAFKHIFTNLMLGSLISSLIISITTPSRLPGIEVVYFYAPFALVFYGPIAFIKQVPGASVVMLLPAVFLFGGVLCVILGILHNKRSQQIFGHILLTCLFTAYWLQQLR